MRRPIGLYCTRQGGTADASSSEYVRVSHCWIYRKLTFSLSCVLRTAPCMMIARRISWQHLPLAPFPFPNPTPLLFTETSLALVKKEGRPDMACSWEKKGAATKSAPNHYLLGGNKTRCGFEGRRVAIEIKSLENEA
jgi:hypothetical protein